MSLRTTFRSLATVAILVPVLVACSDSNSNTASSVAESAVNQATSAVASAASEVKDSASSAAAEVSSAVNGAVPTTEVVTPAVEAFRAKYADALIASIDREDRGTTVEIDVVEGEEIVSYRVTEAGEITEYKRERDEATDVTEAKSASVTADEALKQAKDQHPDGIIDSVSLDSDGGSLQWEVEVDDTNNNEIAQVRIPAS